MITHYNTKDLPKMTQKQIKALKEELTQALKEITKHNKQ